MVALRSRWVLGVSLLACLAALLVALLVGSSSRADDPGAPVTPSPAFATPVTAGEVPALRTESSRTYRKADGSYQAQVSAGPVNYRNASGDWKPIDTDFVSDGDGGLKTTEAAAKVSLPESLDDPAKVTAGSRWVSFEMAGADGDAVPTADGSTATYKEVLDGVDADYDAQPTGVKETLTLADASAPASYRYALDASSGLTPRLLDNGTVVLRDAAGVTRFWLPAPTVQEAGADSPTVDHVAYRLSEDRQTLTVAVDPDWLAQAAFPVQVDPSIWYGDDTSCTLASATPTIAACGGTTLKLGHDAAGKYRTALRFPDMALAVPRTASVMGATIGLFFESQTSATASTPVTVSGLSKLLGPGATWNKYDTNAAHTWTTAGGDIVADPQAAITTLYPSFTTGWVTFNLSRLAERWLRSPSTNNGVLLRAQTETGTNNVLSFDGHTWDHGGPNIRIDYEWHPGFESDQTFEQVAFDGTSKIAVNAATGNVAVDSTDVSLPGVDGLDLKIRRTFNGQNLGSGGGMFGSAWSDGINNAAFLNDRVWYDDSRTIYANGNAIYRFDRDPVHDTATTHAYLSPPNINADLVSNISTGVATLTFRDTGIKWTYRASFDGNNVTLAQISDPAGHHIDITPKAGVPEKIGSITDTNGAVLTFVYGTNGQLTKITKGATEWKYATTIVNGHNLLTGYTNPTNQTTSYHYDAGALPGTWDKLDRVTDTAGQIFRLTYGPQGDWSQVTQVTQDFPDARPDNITKFDYKPVSTLGHACTTPVANSPYPNNVVFDRTVETDNAGRVTTYCYNTSGQVIQSWRPWDTTAPTATPSGAWFDLHEWYSNGVAAQSVTLSATDAVSGVKRVALEEIGKPETAASIASCPPTTTMPNLCPASYSATVTVNPAVLAEGAHSFRQTASDMAGNVGVSTPWIVSIDRTGPGFAAGFSTSASLDPASGTAVIDWDGAADPALPDGSVGSGLAGYTVRTRPAGGAWSAWVPTKLEQALVGGSISGRVYNVEVQPSDQVGNLGAVKAFDVTVTGSGSVCQATANGYPPGCSDDPGGEDTTEPEPAQLVQSTSAGSGSPQTLTAAYRYTVHIGGGGWKTIRRWHNSYVIGNVHDGWQFDQVRQDYTDDVGWITGKIYGQFNACGWIQAEPQTGEGVETACPTHLKIDLERFADGVNCASCNRGTPIQVIRPYPQCRNVSPPPTDNVPTTCLDAITTRTTDQAVTDGYQVAWRYVTNDNRFVLVDDTNVAEGDKSNGFWVFMDRRAFRTPSLCTRNAVKKYDCGAP